MPRTTWTALALLVAACSGSTSEPSAAEGASPASSPSAQAPATPGGGAGDPASAGAESAPDAVEPPLAEAPAPGADPAFDAPAPTRGGAQPLFEAVPQDVLGYLDDIGETVSRASPDGRLSAIPGSSGVVAVFDAATGVARASRRLFLRPGDEVSRIEWDGSGNHLAVVNEGTLCFWNLIEDEYRCPETFMPRRVAVARGGRRAVLEAYDAGEEDDHGIYVTSPDGPARLVAELAGDAYATRLAVYGHLVLATQAGHTWLYDSRGRGAPLDLGEVQLPEHPFAPSGRVFVTLAPESVQLRSASDGSLQGEAPLAGAAQRVRVAIHQDGSRVALCAPDGPLAHVRLGATPAAEEVPDATCTDQSRPALTRTSARVVVLDGDGLAPDRRRDLPDGGREHSLWSIELSPGRAVLHRRGGAEAFSALGVHRARSTVPRGDEQYYEEEFDGLVERSPSRNGALRVDRSDHPVLLTRGTRVRLAGAAALSCREYEGCAVVVRWDRAERRVALVQPNQLDIFDTESGARLGHVPLGRACTDECEEGFVCADGECGSPYSSLRSAEFSPDGERLLTTEHDGTVTLYGVSGERLQRVAPAARGAGPQRFTFSPDGQLIALQRGRRIMLLRAGDGARVWQRDVAHPPWSLTYSPDGAVIHVIDERGQASATSVADGSVSGERELGTPQVVDSQGRYAVTCRDGLTYLQYLAQGAERGPLGRCVRGSRFVIAHDSGLLGAVVGSLARIHRLSDGEVLNLRSVWRERSRVRVAYTDSGWLQVVGGAAHDVYVRTGSISRGRSVPWRTSDRVRETLLADFFSGAALPSPPDAAPDAADAAE